MGYALINHTAKGATNGGTSVTTDAIDNTGADFLVVVVASYSVAVEQTVTDSSTNTWVPRTSYTNGDVRIQIFYVASATVSAAQTFTAQSGGGSYPAIAVCAFSGGHASPYDGENGANNGAGSAGPLSTGSVTPTGSNDLFISGFGGAAATTSESIDSSFTLRDVVAYNSGQSFGVGLAYLIASSSAAQNPAWDWTNSVQVAVDLAAFKAAESGTTPTVGAATLAGVASRMDLAMTARTTVRGQN